MERIRVVARYSNGRIIKGYTIDFFPNKDRFHVILVDKPSERPVEVMVNQLKGVFMVKDFGGNPQYTERKSYTAGETPYGTPLELTFEDGEIMVGSTMGFDLRRQGFFITPADAKSNNIRVFAVCSALKRVRQVLLGAGEFIEVPVPGRKL